MGPKKTFLLVASGATHLVLPTNASMNDTATQLGRNSKERLSRLVPKRNHPQRQLTVMVRVAKRRR